MCSLGMASDITTTAIHSSIRQPFGNRPFEKTKRNPPTLREILPTTQTGPLFPCHPPPSSTIPPPSSRYSHASGPPDPIFPCHPSSWPPRPPCSVTECFSLSQFGPPSFTIVTATILWLPAILLLGPAVPYQQHRALLALSVCSGFVLAREPSSRKFSTHRDREKLGRPARLPEPLIMSRDKLSHPFGPSQIMKNPRKIMKKFHVGLGLLPP